MAGHEAERFHSLGEIWTEGEDAAMSWAENLPDGSLKNFAYGEIGKKIARDLGRAVEWVDGMEESAVKTQVGGVAERLRKPC